MEPVSPLPLRQHIPTQRAQAFVQEKQGQGFSGPEIGLLAQMLEHFSRTSLRVIAAGRKSIAAANEKHLAAVGRHLEQVRTPQELLLARENIYRIWSMEKVEGQSAIEDVVRAFDLLNEPVLSRKTLSWQQGEGLDETLSDPEKLLAFVADTMSREELGSTSEAAQGPEGRKRLQQALAAAGVHTLSWNRWKYPQGDEGVLACQIETAHRALEQTSGLKGPCLGLGGFLRLSLDVVGMDAGALFVHDGKAIVRKHAPRGVNLLGQGRIQLGNESSWGALWHEWVHGLDFATGDLAKGDPGSLANQSLHKTLHRFDRRKEDPEAIRQWLEPLRNNESEWARQVLQTPDEHPSNTAFARAVLGLFEAGDKGSIQAPISTLFKSLTGPEMGRYFMKPEERLAHMADSAKAYLGPLPHRNDQPVARLLAGMPGERKEGVAIVREWLGSGPVQDFWDKVSNQDLPETPLLDAVARRRMKQQRTFARKKRSRPNP